MKSIFFISFSFSLLNFACKYNQEVKSEVNIFDTQFQELTIPLVENGDRFKNLHILDLGYDYFEENFFDSLNVKPINKYPYFFGFPKNLYPYGMLKSKNYPIVFLMKSQKEAGIVEPVIVAYILNNETKKINDSLEVYKTFQWENYYHKNFEITKDSTFIVHELEEYNPYYGDPNNVDSMNVLKTELKSTKYIINHTTNKFDVVK